VKSLWENLYTSPFTQPQKCGLFAW